MQKKFVVVALLALGVLHILPVLGVLDVERLHSLYGVSIADGSLEVLLRHRAVFFGLIGAVMLFAIFKPMYRTIALVMVLVSLSSFLALCSLVDTVNGNLTQIFLIDAAALLLAVVALALHLFPRSET